MKKKKKTTTLYIYIRTIYTIYLKSIYILSYVTLSRIMLHIYIYVYKNIYMCIFKIPVQLEKVLYA